MDSSEKQLDQALLELDDIYQELKVLNQQDPSESPATGNYPSSTTPRSQGKQRVTDNSSAESGAGRGLARSHSERRFDANTAATQKPAMTSDPEWKQGASSQVSLGGISPFPPPPPTSPPPLDENAIIRTKLGHTDSDYDEVPSDDEQTEKPAGANDEIPDYDEIPEEEPAEDSDPPQKSNENHQYTIMRSPPPHSSNRPKEQPFPIYSIVDRPARQGKHLNVDQHSNSPEPHESFYDNYKAENAADNQAEKKSATQTDGHYLTPTIQNGSTGKKEPMTTPEATDDDWNKQSAPETNGNKKEKNVAVAVESQQKEPHYEVIDCTQKPPAHKEGELMCCRLLMSLGIVFAVALFLGILIAFVYFGVTLDRN